MVLTWARASGEKPAGPKKANTAANRNALNRLRLKWRALTIMASSVPDGKASAFPVRMRSREKLFPFAIERKSSSPAIPPARDLP